MPLINILLRQFGLNGTFFRSWLPAGLKLIIFTLCTTLVISNLSIPVSSQPSTIECGDALQVFRVSCFTACEISDQTSIFQKSNFNQALNGWADYQSDASGSSLSVTLSDESCDCCAEGPANGTTFVACSQNTPHTLMHQVLLQPKSIEPAIVSVCRVQCTDRSYDKPDYLSIRATIVIIA